MPWSSSLSFPRTWWGSTRLPRALKPMVPRKKKLGGISPQRAWGEICPEGKRPNNLGHHTNTKYKPRYNFQQGWYPRGKTTNVGNKETGFVVLKQIKFMPRAKWWSWFYGKKPNHVCAVGGMLEVGSIILDQIMIVPRMNVRSWLGGTKPNHICAADGMLVALW